MKTLSALLIASGLLSLPAHACPNLQGHYSCRTTVALIVPIAMNFEITQNSNKFIGDGAQFIADGQTRSLAVLPRLAQNRGLKDVKYKATCLDETAVEVWTEGVRRNQTAPEQVRAVIRTNDEGQTVYVDADLSGTNLRGKKNRQLVCRRTR